MVRALREAMTVANHFGTLPDGRDVHILRLSNGKLTLELLTWGAVIRDLRLSGRPGPLVLGLNTLQDYLAHSPSFGATVGRCANRIAGGRYVFGGRLYQLECNDPNGRHCLHGGSTGLSRSLWDIASLGQSRAVLTITDPEGNAGFPGEVRVSCAISLDGSTLKIRYESTSTRPTPVNVAHHGYFNLSGTDDIGDHTVRIDADRVLLTDAEGIPLNPPREVAGTPYDFRTAARMGARLREGGGFDNNFCLSRERQALRRVASVDVPDGLSMAVETTEPGVQLFTANRLNCPVPGLENRRYGPHAGLCLETQIWPDAINRSDYPAVVLHPGERRVQETHFIFVDGARARDLG